MSDPSLSLAQTLREWWASQLAQHGFTSSLRTFLSELWGFLRDSLPEYRRRRYGDVEYDWEQHVDTTSATVHWRDRLLGIFHSPYQPTEPALFHEMLAALPIDFANFTFIDLGSGKGRTLLMASEHRFRRILGLELLPDLNAIAQHNLSIYSNPNQECFALESMSGDARSFQFPAEPVVLYLFNPLPPAGLAQVICNLERSLATNPRKVWVIYHNPLHEELLLHSSLKRFAGTHQYSIYTSR